MENNKISLKFLGKNIICHLGFRNDRKFSKLYKYWPYLLSKKSCHVERNVAIARFSDLILYKMLIIVDHQRYFTKISFPMYFVKLCLHIDLIYTINIPLEMFQLNCSPKGFVGLAIHTIQQYSTMLKGVFWHRCGRYEGKF